MAELSLDERWKRQGASFGAAAAIYARARPSYPEAALDWLLGPAPGRVLDLGAGTGKLTSQLHARGIEVVAVEPSEGMRAELSRALPKVEVLAGSAENIPLSLRSVETVLVAQAWHWVDPMQATPEVARVLAPGGRLGLIWNIRDDRVNWVRDLARYMPTDARQARFMAAPEIGPPFGALEHLATPWSYQLDRDGLVDLVASRSSTIVLSPEARQVVLDDVRRLLDTDPALKDLAEINMPYVAHAFRTERP